MSEDDWFKTEKHWKGAKKQTYRKDIKKLPKKEPKIPDLEYLKGCKLIMVNEDGTPTVINEYPKRIEEYADGSEEGEIIQCPHCGKPILLKSGEYMYSMG